jgi:N-acetylneuraminic acid mutarotase
MTYRTSLHHALTLGVFTVAGCADSTTPSQPDVPSTPESGLAAPSAAIASSPWISKASILGPEFLYGYSLATVVDASRRSTVYAFGGTTSSEGGSGFRVQAYNVATDTWTGKTSSVDAFNMNGVGKIGNKLYFSGGYNYGGGFRSPNITLYAYDYVNDVMIRKADMPKFTAEGVTRVIDGRLYVLPGTCSGEGPLTDPRYCETEPIRKLYRYTPSTNTWVGLRSAPHYHRGGAAGVINGKFYVAGGFNGYTPVAALDVYDPATNTWSTRAPLPRAGRATGAVLGGKLYVVSSGDGAPGTALRTYVYDPAANIWRTKAAPPVGGPVTQVTLDGRSSLFLANHPSALYTPE